MRNFNEHTITDAVIARNSETCEPRVKEISEALVRHLHAFVREVRPTQKEWEQGIDFLTRTGHMCDDKRQEFILLSDALGVSMLVDAINHPQPEGATETTVLGPFYVQAAPDKALGEDISGGLEGEPLLWARLEVDTLSVYGLAINPDGSFDLYQHVRTVSGDTMTAR